MKTLLILSALAACLYFPSTKKVARQTVNPLLDDVSFSEQFGKLPDKSTNETVRVQTHLAYAEKLLRHTNASHLSTSLQQKRLHLLDLLHTYWTAGVFPRNYDYPNQRVPCFIDKDKRICAVGYLVEQTVGRQTAEAINEGHQYDEVLEMNDAAVDNWIAGSGLSKEECAMIQPTYGYYPPISTTYDYSHIPVAYGATSAVLSGANLSLTTLNFIQLSKSNSKRTAPILGLISGTGQITLGALGFPKEEKTNYGTYTNESKKKLSFLNIGVGTSTLITSIWNLATKKKKVEKSLTWNLYGRPTYSNQTEVGFHITKKI